MTSRAAWLTAKIASEGYCCLDGYLRLCKARGETVQGMADNIGVSKHTIYYHFRRYNSGGKPPVCQRHSDCMKQIIEDVKSLTPSPSVSVSSD